MAIDRERVLRTAKERGLTGYRAAKLAGMSESRLYKALRDRLALRADELEAIANVLGVRVGDLLVHEQASGKIPRREGAA